MNSKPTAVVGAGISAKHYVEWARTTDIDVFTHDGSGALNGKSARPTHELQSKNYSRIVIASQYVEDIADELLNLGVPIESLYWFDFMQKKCASLVALGFECTQDADPLVAVYDLSVYPPNFEIAIFLARAEFERVEKRKSHIVLVIKLGRFGGVTARGAMGLGLRDANWRIHHLLQQVGELLPSCTEVYKIRNQQNLERFCYGYETYPQDITVRPCALDFALAPLNLTNTAEFDVRPFCAPLRAIDFIEQFLSSHKVNRKFIAFTLREYSYQDSRNTCTDTYRQLAEYARRHGYSVVVVRDTNQAFSSSLDWPGIIECPAASQDVMLRMGLYELATLNVSVSCGPAWGLMLLSPNVKFMMTHISNPNFISSSHAFLKERQGISTHQQYKFSGPFQKLEWSTDNKEIMKSFKQLLVELGK